MRSLVCRAAFALVLSGALRCDEPVPHNTAPTVIITAGPADVLPADTATFAWQGEDGDGNLLGFRWWLDDSLGWMWTEDSMVFIEQVGLGPHEFYVQAEDDSGARSVAAVRSFWVEFDSSITPRGTDTTLEVVAWNIQNFPKDGDSTINRLRAAILRLDLDIYGIQEISDTLAFDRLVSGLSDYAGLYSNDDYGSFYMKTGVIYRRDVVQVSNVHQLFWWSDSVTRPPLEMLVTATHNGHTFDFNLIVLHLKAGSSDPDQAQRRVTCRLLKEHIDEQLAGGGEHDFVVIGDWNDRLDDPHQWNVFQQFLDDSLDYRFLTWPFRSNSYYATHIGSGSVIDHIMVTADALEEYGAGETTTLRLDDEMYRYEQVISDHRPVAAWFEVFPR